MRADLRRARRFARRRLGALRRVVSGAIGTAYLRWRQSIQIRVVTSTLFISAIVVAILGAFLMQQMSSALMDGKVKAARLQLDDGLAQVQRDLGNSAGDGSRLNSTIDRLKSRSGRPGSTRSTSATPTSSTSTGTRPTNCVRRASPSGCAKS